MFRLCKIAANLARSVVTERLVASLSQALLTPYPLDVSHGQKADVLHHKNIALAYPLRDDESDEIPIKYRKRE